MSDILFDALFGLRGSLLQIVLWSVILVMQIILRTVNLAHTYITTLLECVWVV